MTFNSCLLSNLFGSSLFMLFCFKFRLLHAFLTCEDNFIESVFGACQDGRNLRIFCICLYVVCIRLVRNSTFLHLFILTIQNIIHDVLFMIWLYLMRVSLGLTYWMTSGFNSYINLEVSYIFSKFPTSLSVCL